MKNLWLVVVSAIVLLLNSCGPFETFTPRMSYDEVTRGVFRSGGVIYSDDESLNQLSGVDFIKISTTAGYYGYIYIESSSNEGIEFEYAIYEDSDKIKSHGVVFLGVSDKVDLDGDGLVDLEIVSTNIFNDSKGYTLLFPYHQDVRKGSRFSARLKNPKGLIGTTQDGDRIFNSLKYIVYQRPTHDTLSFYKNGELPTFKTGDLIVDMRSFLTRSGAVLRKVVDVEDHPDHVVLITETADPSLIYRGLRIKLKGVKLSEFTPLETRRYSSSLTFDESVVLIDTDNLRLSARAVGNLDFVMDLDLDISWDLDLERFYFNVSYDQDTQITLDLFLNLSTTDEGRTPEIVLASYGFDVLGIPIALMFVLYFGYELDAAAQMEFQTGVDFSLGFDLTVEARSIDDWSADANAHGNVSLIGPNVSLQGNIGFVPYAALDQVMNVGGILEVGVGIKPDVEINANGSSSSNGDVLTTVEIKPGLNLHVTGSVDLLIADFTGDWNVLEWDIDEFNFVWGKPAAPVALIAGFQEDGVHLNWRDVSNIEDGYVIWRRRAMSQIWNEVGRTGPDSEEFVDSTAQSDVLYVYGVSAFLNTYSGESYSDSATISVINHSPNIPRAVYPIDGQDMIPVNMTFRWSCGDSDGDSLMYDIYLGESSPPSLVATGLTSSEYSISGLSNDTLYHWKVVAKDGKGGTTESEVWSFRTVPSGFYNLTVRSSPVEGLEVIVDSTHGLTPLTLGLAEGTHTVFFPSPQGSDTSDFVDGTDTAYIFASWDDLSRENPRDVFLDSDLDITSLVRILYRVEVLASPVNAGTVVVDPGSHDMYYLKNTTLEFTAKPAPGYSFDRGILNGENIGSNPLTWNLTQPLKIVAVFK